MRHLQWRTPLPPHIQCWCGTAAQNARACEQLNFRETDCSVCTPTLNIGARGLSYRCVCKAKCTSKRDLFDFESFANLFPSTVKKTPLCMSFKVLRGSVCVCGVLCFGFVSIQTQTDPANPINVVIESFANLLPLTLNKGCVLVFRGLARKCVVCFVSGLCLFKTQTNPTNPINPEFHPAQKAD